MQFSSWADGQLWVGNVFLLRLWAARGYERDTEQHGDWSERQIRRALPRVGQRIVRVLLDSDDVQHNPPAGHDLVSECAGDDAPGDTPQHGRRCPEIPVMFGFHSAGDGLK